MRFAPPCLWFAVCLLIAACAAASSVPEAGLPAPRKVELARTENEPLIDATFPIVREAYRLIGIDAVEVPLPGERAVTALNAGEYFGDVMHAEGLDAVYPNLIRVPVPLIDAEAVIFSYGPPPAVRNWTELAPYRVCIRRGIKAIESSTAHLKNVRSVNQYDFIFRMLKAGHCDLAVLPRSAWMTVAASGVAGIRSAEQPLQAWPLYHYVHKSHAQLVPVLADALRQMQKSGELARRRQDFQRQLSDIRHAAPGAPP